MDLKKVAWVFGIVFVLIGLLGFVPALNPGGLLLGIFQVNAFHNLVHIVSGIAAIAAAMGGVYYAKLYFKVFGVVYGLVTVLGFLTGNGLFGLIPVNMADNLLHLVIAASSLYLGFMGSKEVKKA
jgi:hypothetical protein